MTASARSGFVDRTLLTRAADALAVAVAVSLPWSTSATSILVVVWLVVLLPTLRLAELRRELTTAAGGLPVLLLLFGIAGMLWADVALIERWRGLDSFLKLLVISPLGARGLGVRRLCHRVRGVALGVLCSGSLAGVEFSFFVGFRRAGKKCSDSKRRICHLHLRVAVPSG